MKGFSRHHAFFNRGNYAEPAQRALRCHYGLIALIPNELHFAGFPESVHTLVEEPPVPEYQEILGALALLDSKSQRFLSSPLQVIELTAQYFGTHGNEPLGNNLFRQLDVFGGDIQRI